MEEKERRDQTVENQRRVHLASLEKHYKSENKLRRF